MDPGTPLPAGTITFLFTDIEGSTRLWEQHSKTMRAALARHDALLLGYVAQHEGDCERAARLLGAADALLDAISRCLDPAERAELERHAAAVRTALGEDAFTAAWAAGRPLRQISLRLTGDAAQTSSAIPPLPVSAAPASFPVPGSMVMACTRARPPWLCGRRSMGCRRRTSAQTYSGMRA